MDRVVVDTRRATSLEDVLITFGEALGFFPKYGKNLDALWDCLEDSDLRRIQGPAKVEWVGWRVCREFDRSGFEKIQRQFAETEARLELCLSEN